MNYVIDTGYGKFQRIAWTGGDTPNPEFSKCWPGLQLVSFYLMEQIEECGGKENLVNWLFGNQTVQDKIDIFTNRAILDAWVTSKHPIAA
jgi:hypothetical protein